MRRVCRHCRALSHLAYSAEIAAAMLQRQQASAVVAARQKIVEGAVGMVETALELAEKHVVELDDERRASTRRSSSSCASPSRRTGG